MIRARSGSKPQIGKSSREKAERRQADHQRAADDRADHDRKLQIAGRRVAHAAHGRLGKTCRAEADQKPRGKEKRRRNGPVRRGGKKGMFARRCGCRRIQRRRFKPARIAQNRPPEHDEARKHENGADGVRPGDGPVSAHRRVEHDENTEERERRFGGQARRFGKDCRAADELPRHHRREEDEKRSCGKNGESPTLIPRAQKVDHGDCADPSRNESHAAAHEAEEEKARNHLRSGEGHPGAAHRPGNARSGNEGAHRAVGGEKRHRENDALQASRAEKVVRGKSGAERPLLRAALGPNGRGGKRRKEDEDRHKNEACHFGIPSSASSSGQSSG